ncbi:response regulator [Methylobacterium sp. MA0201]|uniref:response regulator n=1 Tax=Methylobacterium alsaeris TaxID=3344826 RepID=UPI00375674F2
MLTDKAILVVEDEPLIAAMLDDLLTDLGCRVLGPAMNLKQAHALLERGGCDAAIVDLNLNGTMAHPLIEALHGRGVPVIVATGYGSTASDLPDGCRMLAKPYAIQHVEEALRACLGG